MVSLLVIGQDVKRQRRVKLAEGQDGRQHQHDLGQRHCWGFFLNDPLKG
jgi:hypothetical protein